MPKHFGRLAALGFACAFAASAACGGHGTPETMLVSTDWLAAHLHDAKVVILAVGPKGEYAEGHIPGALELPYASITPAAGGLATELPPMADLATVFGSLGVSNDSHIVLYTSKEAVSWTTRAFLTLDAMGLGPQTSLLDGGFLAWTTEHRPATTEVPTPAKGKVTPCAQQDIIVDRDYVSGNLHKPGVAIVDARNTEYYTGARLPNGQRAGHIPGAVNITFSTLTDAQNRLKAVAALKQQFQAAGIKPGDRVVSYCHIGQQATVIYFVARYLGYDARLYDGSWQDWSAHTELPAETAAEKH